MDACVHSGSSDLCMHAFIRGYLICACSVIQGHLLCSCVVIQGHLICACMVIWGHLICACVVIQGYPISACVCMVIQGHLICACVVIQGHLVDQYEIHDFDQYSAAANRFDVTPCFPGRSSIDFEIAFSSEYLFRLSCVCYV